MQADASSKKIISLKNKGFDTIVCFNVLEHIERDDLALENFYEILPKGGVLLVVVPAFDFLFGSMDKYGGHFRRYSVKTLRQKLEKAGFCIEKVRFQNVLGIVGWFLGGKIAKKKLVPEKLFVIFDKFVPFLFEIERLFGPPFGLSILCVAKKLACARLVTNMLHYGRSL